MSRIGTENYTWKDTLKDGANYYYDNRKFIINALKHTKGQDYFAEYVRNTNTNLLIREIKKKSKFESIPKSVLGLIKVYVYGTVQFMIDWLIGNFSATPEEIADIWEESLPSALKGYLYS